MLGLTSYQEALRAVGRIVGEAEDVRIVEHAESGWVDVTLGGVSRRVGVAELEDLVLSSLAARGERQAAGPSSDVLRSVGLALDELQALAVSLVLQPDGLHVQFLDRQAAPRELSYVGNELEVLRQAAAARRNGQPLRRVLILDASPTGVEPLVALLVAEFAVQALPAAYARAIAATSEPPDLVLVQASPRTLDALRLLRAGVRTASVPVLVLLGPETNVDAGALFEAGADDVLQEPVQPAQLRARIRTSLLRQRPTTEP